MGPQTLSTIPASNVIPFDESYTARLVPLVLERLKAGRAPDMSLPPGVCAFKGEIPLGDNSPLFISYVGLMANGRTSIMAAQIRAF